MLPGERRIRMGTRGGSYGSMLTLEEHRNSAREVRFQRVPWRYRSSGVEGTERVTVAAERMVRRSGSTDRGSAR
jgi:hypothetical protein